MAFFNKKFFKTVLQGIIISIAIAILGTLWYNITFIREASVKASEQPKINKQIRKDIVNLRDSVDVAYCNKSKTQNQIKVIQKVVKIALKNDSLSIIKSDKLSKQLAELITVTKVLVAQSPVPELNELFSDNSKDTLVIKKNDVTLTVNNN